MKSLSLREVFYFRANGGGVGRLRRDPEEQHAFMFRSGWGPLPFREPGLCRFFEPAKRQECQAAAFLFICTALLAVLK